LRGEKHGPGGEELGSKFLLLLVLVDGGRSDFETRKKANVLIIRWAASKVCRKMIYRDDQNKNPTVGYKEGGVESKKGGGSRLQITCVGETNRTWRAPHQSRVNEGKE